MLTKNKTTIYNIMSMLAKNSPMIQTDLPAKLPFRMNFDGCSKGNPGLCGAGAAIYRDGVEIWGGSVFVGTNDTNNRAEYMGLIFGLQKAVEMQIKEIHVQGDSQLVINQMTGKYKCNSPNLVDLYETAKGLEKEFANIQYEHILRNFNKRADELSNIPVYNYLKKTGNVA